MLNVKYLLESRREDEGPPMGGQVKKDAHRILPRQQKTTAYGRG
jgi:hypothetical protein